MFQGDHGAIHLLLEAIDLPFLVEISYISISLSEIIMCIDSVASCFGCPSSPPLMTLKALIQDYRTVLISKDFVKSQEHEEWWTTLYSEVA